MPCGDHLQVDEKSGRDEEGAAMEMGSIRLNVVPHLWAFSDCTFGVAVVVVVVVIIVLLRVVSEGFQAQARRIF